VCFFYCRQILEKKYLDPKCNLTLYFTVRNVDTMTDNKYNI